MKRYLIKRTVIAGIALLSVPAVFAQDAKDKDKKEKQQIVITQDIDPNEKTVIEIKGDKITVNGKDVKDVKGDVSVRVNKIKDAQAYRAVPVPRGGSFFNENNDDFSFFSEDENRAMLGVVTDHDEKGAKITSVSKESGAEKAGLKVGDIITKIDDQKIDDTETVAKAIRKHKPGDKVTITVLRDDKEQKITAELGKWKGMRVRTNPPNVDFFREMPQIELPEVYGNLHIAPSPRLGLSVQDTEDGKGVKVIEIDEDSNAGKAGIKEDDIITHVDDKAVNSATEISKIVKESKDKASVRFQVLRNGKSQNIEVKVPRKLRTANL